MEVTINYREELEKARAAVKDLKRDGYQSTIDAYWAVCCCDVLVAEENLREQTHEWENSSLAREFLDIATYLEGYDHMLASLNSATSRMIDTIFGRPRLKLKLLNFELTVLRRIEAQTGHEMSICDHVRDDISFYSRNIECANKGDFKNIEQRGHLKRDPIEWSPEYECIIDEAEKKIDDLLSGEPRGMGFCFSYWHTKENVLSEDYGIEWRNPAIMNPGVHFD